MIKGNTARIEIKHLYSGQFNIGMHISVARLVLQGENRRATAG
jgi:hypothetical protein